MEGELYNIEVEEHALPSPVRLPARVLILPQKACAKLDDVNGRGIVVARRKAEQNDDLFLVRCAVNRHGVGVKGFERRHVVAVYKQPFGYFRVAAAQIFRLDGIDGRDGAALFVGDIAEDGFKQAPIYPIIPERRIGFLPA